VVEQACGSVTRNAPQSSNLAAFSLHATRMLRELASSGPGGGKRRSAGGDGNNIAVDEFSNRIATVGRARATAGALNLLRILVHAVIVHSRSPGPQEQQQQSPDHYLQECFLYKSRDSAREQDTGSDLIDALVSFLNSNPPLTSTIPELYDTAVLSFQMLLVLLSSQLYQPMISSFMRADEEDEYYGGSCGFFWDKLMALSQAYQHQQQATISSSSSSPPWAPRSLLETLLDWTLYRPSAPQRSIAQHNAELAKQVVMAKGERMGADGMYENHMIVMACAPQGHEISDGTEPGGSANASMAGAQASKALRRNSNLLLDATKGVLVLSSTIILLPFRLVRLAIGLWGNKEKGYDQAHRKMLQSSFQPSNLTKDVLWLSDSPVADLASSVMLLILNNERAGDDNPYRQEIMALTDNRWETEGYGLPDLPDLPNLNGGWSGEEAIPLVGGSAPPVGGEPEGRQDVLAINFETLFESFGRTSHTEVGALLLYTLMQSSTAFAESLAVRSDLDTLVMPLLRTLYVSSSVRHYAAQDFVSRATGATRRPSTGDESVSDASAGGVMSIRNCPFRSQSQLYVIIILLLLFSQDQSFGSDAFRRTMVSSVPWYKERHIKDINLGSVLLMCLLRALTFNLNRLHDAFLLSNCCAILMNLSPAISDLHEYAAMRLVATTVTSMKRYASLRKESPDSDEEALSTSTAMHGEVCRTLLRVLKQALSSTNIDRNLNLVYALVYHQADFKKATGKGKNEDDNVTLFIFRHIAAIGHSHSFDFFLSLLFYSTRFPI